MVCFRIEGRPRGKERPRYANGHMYTPVKTRDYEAMVRRAFDRTGAGKIGGYINLYVTACFDIPKSYSKQKKSDAMAGLLRPGKPDLDNILKIVADALNGYAYDDDARVVFMTACKKYTPGFDGVFVTLESTDGRIW